MFVIFLILSIVIFLGSSIASYVMRREQVSSLTTLFVGLTVATGFLVFPLLSCDDFWAQLIQTVFYAVKLSTMEGNFGILKQAPTELSSYFTYLLYFYSVLAPILAAGVIISFIGNKIDEFRAKRKTTKTVHIFSEINEKSVLLAEALKDSNTSLIFCDAKDKKEYYERIKKKGGIILKRGIRDIRFHKYKGEVYVYEISEDQECNLERTLVLLSMLKGTDIHLTIYVFSLLEEAQVILDSAEKGGIKTVLINEAQQIVYHVLREKPMYQNVTNGKLEVLIVGCGRIGMEFLKTISWCGQMIGYDLKIHVVDKRAHLIEQQFLWQCPGLKEPEYDICFYEVDVNTKAMEEVLECLDENVSYVIVALGNDQDNLNTSILLRRYFLMKQKRPMIGLVIQDVLKKKHVEQLKNERGGSYQLYSFGSEADLYGKRTVLNEEIESLAKKVHLAYNPQDQSLEEYYKIEYYKKSSRALALHIPYKIYSVSGKENLTYQELRCLVNDPNVREQLAKNEHNRWKAYLLSDGYRKASIKQVEQYEKEIHHHVYHLAKLHPALVDFEELELLSERIEEISGKMIDLKKSDYDIVGAIPEILKDNIGSDIDGRTED